MPLKTLPVDPEDVDDFIGELEKSLGIAFDSIAFAQAESLGAVSDRAANHIPLTARSGGKCPTLITYNRLRSLLLCQHPKSRLTPKTRLQDLSGFSYNRLKADLQAQGWALPPHTLTRTGCALPLWVSLLTVLALTTFNISYPVIILGAFVALLLASVTVCRVEAFTTCNAQTIGDLTRDLCTRNIGRLIDEGASFNTATVWRMFEREFPGIRPETPLA